MASLAVVQTAIWKSYEIVAAKACKSSAEYLDNIYCCIIDYLRDDKFEQFYKDRKRILSVMQAVPTEHYWNELSSLNRIDALSCLTCLTDVEQKTIFEIVAEFSYQQRKSVLSILKRVYPSLYYYLQNDEQPNCAGLSTEHEQYFSEYKWLKATDTLTEEFVSKVKRISLEKGHRSSRCNQGIILFQNTMMSIHLSYLWMEWVLNMLITWRISSPTLMSSSIQYSLMLVFAHYRQSQKSTKIS